MEKNPGASLPSQAEQGFSQAWPEGISIGKTPWGMSLQNWMFFLALKKSLVGNSLKSNMRKWSPPKKILFCIYVFAKTLLPSSFLTTQIKHISCILQGVKENLFQRQVSFNICHRYNCIKLSCSHLQTWHLSPRRQLPFKPTRLWEWRLGNWGKNTQLKQKKRGSSKGQTPSSTNLPWGHSLTHAFTSLTQAAVSLLVSGWINGGSVDDINCKHSSSD